MSNTFIKLPTYDTEIEHVREMYRELKGTEFQFMKWKPRPALIEKNGKTSWLYTGQRYDPERINYVEDGWTHDHCEICSITISGQESEYIVSEGYFNGYEWLCKNCYETFISTDDLERKLNELPKYQK